MLLCRDESANTHITPPSQSATRTKRPGTNGFAGPDGVEGVHISPQEFFRSRLFGKIIPVLWFGVDPDFEQRETLPISDSFTPEGADVILGFSPPYARPDPHLPCMKIARIRSTKPYYPLFFSKRRNNASGRGSPATWGARVTPTRDRLHSIYVALTPGWISSGWGWTPSSRKRNS